MLQKWVHFFKTSVLDKMATFASIATLIAVILRIHYAIAIVKAEGNA